MKLRALELELLDAVVLVELLAVVLFDDVDDSRLDDSRLDDSRLDDSRDELSPDEDDERRLELLLESSDEDFEEPLASVDVVSLEADSDSRPELFELDACFSDDSAPVLVDLDDALGPEDSLESSPPPPPLPHAETRANEARVVTRGADRKRAR